MASKSSHASKNLSQFPIYVVLVSGLILSLSVLYVSYYAVPNPLNPLAKTPPYNRNGSLEEWIEWETRQATNHLLDNIAPGAKAQRDTVPGTVIASPSRSHPDYYYQWTRDSAIVMSTFSRNLTQRGGPDPYLEGYLDRFVSLQRKLQRVENPSGQFSDLTGLGEPKFQSSGAAFTGHWGRPQRDGPALRALTSIEYLRAYNASHPDLWTSTKPGGKAVWFKQLYESTMPPKSLIKADLEYVANFWQQTGFDLWEEVDGLHFFTIMVQRKALKEGADVASRFGDPGATAWYKKQYAAMSNTLDKFWNQYENRIMATLGTLRSGLDCGNLLGAVHGAADDADAYPPWRDEILVGLLDLVSDQRKRFPINRSPDKKAWPFKGVVIGRYPEDEYDGDGKTGGHPWFLCTATVSEILYVTASHFNWQGQIQVTSIGQRFWAALIGRDCEPGDIIKGNDLKNVTRTLVRAGDSFLAAIRLYVDHRGSMSEQIDGITGKQVGAKDLTWSYSSFLRAVEARKKAIGTQRGGL